MPQAAPSRALYLDHLRAASTALVLLHHTAITYGGSGGWFYREIDAPAAPSSLVLTLFCATNQAWFMGLFFLLAGYFTPNSLDRKGYGRFLLDRFLRLGLPLLAFILALGPFTVALVDAAGGDGFWPTIPWLWHHHRILNGPLWFAQALLIFSLGYCLWRVVAARLWTAKAALTRHGDPPMPSPRAWLLSAMGVAVGALLLRQFVPVGESVFGLQLGYFASYLFLFGLGIAARRNNWLERLQWKHARGWIVVSALTWIGLPVSLLLARAQAHASGGEPNFAGGLSWPAVFYALWEPFVAWGVIALALLWFRDRVNQPSRFWAWLSRRAYAVYVIHPPVLVGISLLLAGWHAPALVKFAATGSLACVAAWLLADPLVRLPAIRQIL